jgi:hypothetical protein
VSLEKTHNPSALVSVVVIVLSGVRVLRYHNNQLCVTAATVYWRERGPQRFVWKLDSGNGGGVREEPEAEHHLRVGKARDSLWSYSIQVLGPRVGYPLHRGTNED